MQVIVHAQSVAINDDASLPHSSAILDVKVAGAAKKGVLLPRMTGAQRAAIGSPAKGLLVYDSTSNSFWFHNGTAWTELSKGINAWTVNGTNVYNLAANIGIGVSTPRAKLNVVQNQNVLFGSSMSGIGKKLFWNGTKGAFRAGNIAGEYPNETAPFPWDDSRVGESSFATGRDTEASGLGSAAFGNSTNATENWSMAGGTWSGAHGWNSFAYGFASEAGGDESFAGGYRAVASGEASASFNSETFSLGGGSFTAGSDNTSYGETSATFGLGNYNTALAGFVIGQYNDSITSITNGSAATAPLLIIGNGNFSARRNAFVVLRNGSTGINKNPGSVAVNDGLLQLKQSGARHLLTLEAATTVNKWSFSMTPNLVFYYNNVLRGTFNSATGAYVASSDSRLKKDINELSPVLSDLMQLKTYTYHFLDNDSDDPYTYGLMAQELKEIYPDLVSKIEPENESSLLGISYSNLGVLAIKAIQEQQQIIESQHKRIDELEARLNALEKRDQGTPTSRSSRK
jgi:hypothetical protein